jgi:hypothetical protein
MGKGVPGVVAGFAEASGPLWAMIRAGRAPCDPACLGAVRWAKVEEVARGVVRALWESTGRADGGMELR